MMAMKFRSLPLMHYAAEYLVMAYLMRRNIMAYRAPENNEGYDLICVHPNPRRKSKVVRIQVKSRYQTDSDASVFVRGETFDAFDFLVIVLLNVGYYYSEGTRPVTGREQPRLITLPRSIARRWWRETRSGMNRVRTWGKNLGKYENENGIELIAKWLGVPYPNPKKNN